MLSTSCEFCRPAADGIDSLMLDHFVVPESLLAWRDDFFKDLAAAATVGHRDLVGIPRSVGVSRKSSNRQVFLIGNVAGWTSSKPVLWLNRRM
jgi:hypothetical protein